MQGKVLLREALASEVAVRWVIARESDATLLENVKDGRVTTYLMDDESFDSLNDTVTPQGVLAVCETPVPVGAMGGTAGWVVVADRISDPGNLGTILRSAEAAGAGGVVVTAGTVDPFSPKSVRASAGAVLHIPIHSVPDLAAVKAEGFRLIGTTSHIGPGVCDVWDADFGGRVGLVLGNEAHGLDHDAPLDGLVAIPHAGRAESLNVGMAATVAAMQVSRWRSRSAGR